MPILQDWAAKAAEDIYEKRNELTEERIAAIIAIHAEPLECLLRESKKPHYNFCKRWPEEDPECSPDMKCNCGADEWNSRVEAVLDGTTR